MQAVGVTNGQHAQPAGPVHMEGTSVADGSAGAEVPDAPITLFTVIIGRSPRPSARWLMPYMIMPGRNMSWANCVYWTAAPLLAQ